MKYEKPMLEIYFMQNMDILTLSDGGEGSDKIEDGSNIMNANVLGDV